VSRSDHESALHDAGLEPGSSLLWRSQRSSGRRRFGQRGANRQRVASERPARRRVVPAAGPLASGCFSNQPIRRRLMLSRQDLTSPSRADFATEQRLRRLLALAWETSRRSRSPRRLMREKLPTRLRFVSQDHCHAQRESSARQTPPGPAALDGVMQRSVGASNVRDDSASLYASPSCGPVFTPSAPAQRESRPENTGLRVRRRSRPSSGMPHAPAPRSATRQG
jgi:hypothetical protein